MSQSIDPTIVAISPNAGPVPSTTNWRYWLPRIASGIIVPVLLLGMVELGLRLCRVGNNTSVTLPCTDQGRPGFCDNQSFTNTFFPPDMARTPRPYWIPADKQKGTFRIFVLGESAAFGDPDPTYGFSRYLEVMLRERFPGVNFEVINTGTTAINSHVILPIAQEIARHQPDMYVIYAGSNEVVGPYGPGTVLTSPSSSLAIIRASIFLKSTRIGQLVGKLNSPSGNQQQWRGMEMFLEQQVRGNSPQMGPVYDNFESNLRDIVKTGRNSGARVLVSTIATNLRDCAPFASLHREGLGQEALQKWTSLVKQAIVLEDAGSYKDALSLYLSAEAIDPEYAETQFRIARCLWQLGDYSAAKQRFTRAQDLDTLHFRADSKINEVIRSVATSGGTGVELVDAAEEFSKNSPHGIAGGELLREHVHMNPEGNYLLARILFNQIVSNLPQEMRATSTRADVPSQMECDRFLALTRYDRARLAKLVLRKMERAPFTNQFNIEEEMAKLRIEAEAPVDSYEDTVAQYQWAIARYPSDRSLHLNYGFFLHQEFPIVSSEEFKRALPYDNAPVLCNWRKFE